jgi:hypothetical protein
MSTRKRPRSTTADDIAALARRVTTLEVQILKLVNPDRQTRALQRQATPAELADRLVGRAAAAQRKRSLR